MVGTRSIMQVIASLEHNSLLAAIGFASEVEEQYAKQTFDSFDAFRT